MLRSPMAEPIVCLDLEGVLIPEIWIAVAEELDIEALRLTTRDIADYDELMTHRLGVLREHGVGLGRIEAIAGGLDPLPGAADFLAELRSRRQVVILSDTFYEFAGPLMVKLGQPALWCHRLDIGADGMIDGYMLRQQDQKRHAVNALRGLNFEVSAAGDSYNDIGMLEAAQHGYLFNAPARVREEFAHFRATDDHAELLTWLLAT